MKKTIFSLLIFIPSIAFSLTYSPGNGTIGQTSIVTLSSMTATNVITSSITITNLFVLPSNAAPRTNVIPGATGVLILNTGSDPDQVCQSTGTLITQWMLIGSANTPCAN